MRIRPLQFRKMFADDLLTYLNSLKSRAADFQSNQQNLSQQNEITMQCKKIFLPTSSSRTYKFTRELWPLINDYHKHLRDASIGQEMQKRILQREFQQAWEKKSWIECRQTLIDWIEDVTLRQILKTQLYQATKFANSHKFREEISQQHLNEMKNRLLIQALNSPKEIKTILEGQINFIAPDQQQYDDKSIANRVKDDKFLRLLIFEYQAENFNDIRKHLASFELGARYAIINGTGDSQSINTNLHSESQSQTVQKITRSRLARRSH